MVGLGQKTLAPSFHQGNRTWHSELAFLFWQPPISMGSNITKRCSPALAQLRVGVGAGTSSKSQEEVSDRVVSIHMPLACWGHGSMVELLPCVYKSLVSCHHEGRVEEGFLEVISQWSSERQGS